MLMPYVDVVDDKLLVLISLVVQQVMLLPLYTGGRLVSADDSHMACDAYTHTYTHLYIYIQLVLPQECELHVGVCMSRYRQISVSLKILVT